MSGAVELIVTPEMRERIARKRQKRTMGQDISGSERGEVDLGDVDDTYPGRMR